MRDGPGAFREGPRTLCEGPGTLPCARMCSAFGLGVTRDTSESLDAAEILLDKVIACMFACVCVRVCSYACNIFWVQIRQHAVQPASSFLSPSAVSRSCPTLCPGTHHDGEQGRTVTYVCPYTDEHGQ